MLALNSAASAQSTKGGNMPLSLATSAFPPGGNIPAKYTCQGADVSPALSWKDAPDKTKTFALIVADPDAPVGNWTHWVLYNLPASVHELPEDVAKTEALPNGGQQGRNDFHRAGYGGPCPPPGKPHRYFFKLYAMDSALDLPAGASQQQLEKAMHGHILAQAELMGKFQK
jgi:Raf kinase inhibitor-like YbhB/YbcL family protein